ncbi:MAG: MATE family efflux transporter [Candidatus Aenigmarchaeota archaeon]|nr:MATE family efflux transporter [Candidatus Aenigmarchaeota archaeon]
MENKLTEGSIAKSIIALSIPIIITQILQSTFQIVDTLWVGRLGAEAVAAIAVSFPIIFTLFSFGLGFTTAGTTLVSQFKGKGDEKEVNRMAGQTILLVMFLSVILSILGYFLSEPLLVLMGAGKDILPQATSYIQISFIGMVFMFYFFAFQSLMRGIGNVKTPLYLMLLAVCLNAIVDPILIFGLGPIPAFGVSGAAIATVATQAIAAIIGFFLLSGGKHGIHIKLSNMKPDFTLMKKMFYLGFPASLEQTLISLNIAAITVLAAAFGTTALASYGIWARISIVVIIPAMGISFASATLIGQNIGAGKIERAESIAKTTALYSFLILSAIGIVLFFTSEQIASIFIPGNTAVSTNAALYIRIVALSMGFFGILQTFLGTLRGSGSMVLALAMAILTLWIVRIPLSYYLSHFTALAESGIYYGFAISNIFGAAFSYFLFWQGKWKKLKLTEEFKLKEKIEEEILEELVH